jgi:hypothetical protein
LSERRERLTSSSRWATTAPAKPDTAGAAWPVRRAKIGHDGDPS